MSIIVIQLVGYPLVGNSLDWFIIVVILLSITMANVGIFFDYLTIFRGFFTEVATEETMDFYPFLQHDEPVVGAYLSRLSSSIPSWT